MDVEYASGDEGEENFEDDASSNDEESEVDEEKKAAEIQKLEQLMKQGSATNAQLLQLVELLSDDDEIERARACREALHTKFCLTEQDWLSWLDDELAFHEVRAQTASNEDTVRSLDHILSLFQRATHDYESLRLWDLYTKTLLVNLACETVTIERVRNVFEQAVEQVGLNAEGAYGVRKAYREFEITLLEQMVEGAAEEKIPLADEERQAQVDRVVKLFRRELRVPHENLDDVVKEYQAFRETWQQASVDEEAERLSNEAKRTFALVEGHEQQLNEFLQSEPELTAFLAFWTEYIAFVRKDSNAFSRSYVVHLYERAICAISDSLTDNSQNDRRADADLTAFLCSYLEYLETELRDRQRYTAVLERITRICYSNSTLWCRRLRDCERRATDKRAMRELCETALSKPFATVTAYKDIWQAYLDYLRRRLLVQSHSEESESDASCQKPQDEALQEFRNAAQCGVDYVEAIGADAYGELARFWAYCEARAGCMQEAREIWRSRLFRRGFDQLSTYCVEQAELERRFANAGAVRSAYSKALHTVTDYPTVVDDAFLRFEREDGSLESFCKALQLVEQIRAQRARRAAESDQSNNKKRAGKQTDKGDRKRKGQQEIVADSKRQRYVAESQQEATYKQTPVKPADKKQDKKADEQAAAANTAKPKRVEHDPSKDDVTVFVSNLPFTFSEDAIKNEFETCGSTTEIRLVRDARGRSKGYAYVQFAHKLSVEAAIARDRSMLAGRPMFVSRCNPDRSQASFRFAGGLEPTKLFVRNLPLTITQQAVETIFAQYGKLRAVRLVTFRNGRPKGIAYVEYESEESARKAVTSADNLLVGEREISVALSDPSAAQGERRTLTDFLRQKRESKILTRLGASKKGDGGEEEEESDNEEEDEEEVGDDAAPKQSKPAQSAARNNTAETARKLPPFKQPDTKPKPVSNVLSFAPRIATVASKRLDLGVVVKRTATSADRKPAETVVENAEKVAASAQQAKLSNDEFRRMFLKQ